MMNGARVRLMCAKCGDPGDLDLRAPRLRTEAEFRAAPVVPDLSRCDEGATVLCSWAGPVTRSSQRETPRSARRSNDGLQPPAAALTF